MNKYSEPMIEIRKYALRNDTVFTSDTATNDNNGSLEDGDDYDLFGNQ